MKDYLVYQIRTCPECQRQKKLPEKQKADLLHQPVGKINEQYVFDTLGSISAGNTRKFVQVATECVTRFVTAKIVDYIRGN